MRRVLLSDLTAGHLREGILSGRWKDRLPGIRPLAEELAVARHTLRAAIRLLVAEGLLGEGGDGGSYTIVETIAPAPGPRPLRVGLLLMGPMEAMPPAVQADLTQVIGQLKEAGHFPFIQALPAGKDPHKTGYMPRLVAESGADAWVISLGTLEVLEWFVAAGMPALALGGRCTSLPIASIGLDGASFSRMSVRRLAELGHRRVVLITAHNSRLPAPSSLVLAFREELERVGICSGDYHTPDWEETPDGLVRLLDELFRVTPPTALLCHPLNATFGTLNYLQRRGLRVPQDVSVISMDDDTSLGWHHPGLRLAHMWDDPGIIFRRVREWVEGVAAGKPNTRRQLISPEIIEGNTIGPAKAGGEKLIAEIVNPQCPGD